MRGTSIIENDTWREKNVLMRVASILQLEEMRGSGV
jgi:hypothetical protein